MNIELRKMIRPERILLASVVGTGCLSAQSLKTVSIPDPAWNMTAAQAQVPAGWRFAGAAVHPVSCALPFYDIKTAAASPDRSVLIAHFPTIQYSHSANPQVNAEAAHGGCIIASSPQEFLTKVVAPNLHPGAQVAGVQRMPGSEQMIAQMTQQDQQAASRRHHSMGSYEQVADDVIGMQLNYTRNGVAVTSIILGQFHCIRGVYPGAHQDSTNCMVNNLVDTQAPSAQASAVFNSVKGPVLTNTPQWEARARQAIDQQAAATQRQMSQQFAADQAATTDIHQQTMQMINGYARTSQAIHNQNEAYHQSNKKYAESLGDQQGMVNQQTGTAYELSDQYAHTYQSTTDGTILQTNSAYSPGDASLWTVLTPR